MPNLIGFLIVLFFIAAFLRVDFFFTILYLLFAIYLISRLWMRRSASNLEASRRFIERAFLGDEVSITLTVSNRGWLPIPWIRVWESLPVDLIAPPMHREVIGLRGYEERELHYHLTCRRRGYYPLGPLQLDTGDLLGIHETVRQQIDAEYLIVYPKVVALGQLGLPTRSPLVVLRAHSPLFEDPSRIMGVRDYEVGDSPRRIHWTATASAGRLLVKQYEPAIARDTFICLDLDPASYEFRRRRVATELAIVTAASLANHIITREGLPVGMATMAWDQIAEEDVHFSLPLRKEKAHLMNILEVLARAQMLRNGGESFVDLLQAESVDLPWGATVVAITGCEEPEIFNTLLQLRRSGFSVALILVQAALLSAELQGRAELLGISVHRVWEEEDLEVLA
ncbi:MAG: DUF58 domain-containing protein [Anaerolineae bacterium]